MPVPSLQQEPLWFLHRLDPKDSAYHIAFSLDFTEAPDLAALSRSLRHVVETEEGLSMVLRSVEGRAQVEFRNFESLAVTRLDEAEVAAFVDRPFNLEEGPLFRFGWCEASRSLVAVFHHVIFDGTSVQLFIDELAQAHRAVSVGQPPGQVLSEARHGDFVARQRRFLEGAAAKEAREYFSEVLGDAPFFALAPERVGFEPKGGTVRRVLPPRLRADVESLAGAYGVTPFMVLLAAFELLLGRQAGLDDVTVGIPVSLRMDPAIRNRVGIFVNPTVIRLRFEDDPSFAELLRRTKEACVGAFRHQRLPFAQVVEAISPERTAGQNPLFSVMFILQEAPSLPDWPGLNAYRELTPSSAKFPLTGAVAVAPEQWDLSLEYREDLFRKRTIEALGERFEVLLDSAARAPETPVSSLEYLTGADRVILREVAQGPEAVGEGAPLHLRFEALLAAEPSRVVLRNPEGRETTRAELASMLRRQEGGLRAVGVQAGDRVGLALPPDERAVATALALFRIGAAYVPLDVDLPDARLATLVSDAGVRTLVTAENSRERLRRATDAAVHVWRDLGLEEPAEPLPEPSRDATALAYVIYTSGSTGRPKGVEITQAGLSVCLDAFRAGTPIPDGARWLALTHLAFDIVILELFYPLVFGGVAQLVPRSIVRDGSALARWLETAPVDVVQTTPTRFRMLLAAGWKGGEDLIILVGGERLTVELARELRARAGTVVNVYGPTEGTVWSTAHVVADPELDADPRTPLPVGRPLPGVRAYVLDGFGHRVPVGVPGELHLAGPQLGRGYLDPAATQSAWGPRPHVGEGRAYATGDRVRLREDGVLEFLGRRDDQVKLRGHRIELGEVQAALRDLPMVREAAVRLSANREQLWAYAVPDAGTAPSGRQLREGLFARLPEAWVPQSIVVLESLPRTPSGKIDAGALPAPKIEASEEKTGRVQTLLELQIARVWSDVFKRPSVARDDDFFALGGQSILAVELAVRLERELDRPVRVMDVFRTRTVAGLAALIEDGGGALPWRTLIAHRAQGSRPPLFMIDAGHMHRLGELLDDEIPVFSLMLFGLVPDHGALPRMDVPEIAKRFLEEIRRVQSRGPYRLLAYCQDTKLMVEMGRQLEASGETISFLGAIDVIGRAQHRFKIRQAAALFLEYGTDYPRGVLRRRGRYYRSLLTRLKASVTGSASSERSRHDLFYAHYLEALDAYRPEPLEAEATFLVSTEYFRRTTEREILKLARGRARVFEVPGFHDTLFEPPWVHEFARRLSSLLT